MSRLSEILGVPEGREFRFRDGTYRIKGNRRYYYSDPYEEWKTGIDEDILADMLDNPELIELIAEKPKLTDQQITAIKGRIAEGTPWAVKIHGEVWFYNFKPVFDADGDIDYCKSDYDVPLELEGNTKFYDFIAFENSPVYLPDLIEGNIC